MLQDKLEKFRCQVVNDPVPVGQIRRFFSQFVTVTGPVVRLPVLDPGIAAMAAVDGRAPLPVQNIVAEIMNAGFATWVSHKITSRIVYSF